jgi:hypothetical protein
MSAGRPKGSGTPFFCRTCQITSLLKTIHLKSVGHRQNRRIRALLKQPCISFSEIGRRLGVSRERVRQIADRFCPETGRQRQYSCAINNPPNLPSNCLALRAEKVCREKGIPFQFARRLIGVRLWPSTNAAIIANQKCLLRHSPERENGNIVLRRPTCDHKDFKFLLSPLTDGRWMIIPKAKWPGGGSTEFRPGDLRRPGGKSKRHDWPAYIDAWHLLKNEQQA